MSTDKIIYTLTDEAPALATHSLLPIVKAFTDAAGLVVETRDISLAGRILANLSDWLPDEHKRADDLAELGRLAQTPEANIIKLPNISASMPQLQAAIKELKGQGFELPDYPHEPDDEAQRRIEAAYTKVLGSAVNPVLREGNSDRRVAAAVKAYARKNPHSMGEWSADSKSHVAHMTEGDFYASERSVALERGGELTIVHTDTAGNARNLKESIPVLEGEVVDAAVMSCRALKAYYEREIEAAKSEDILLSLHLKATMMRVSDPIMFGHCVEAYYSDLFEKHAALFEELGVVADNGIGDVYSKMESLPEPQQAEIRADIDAVYASRPRLAMVDSHKGITNLHVPSNVIIDASMPAAIRSSGKMWGADDALHDTKALIPDRCYAGIYQEVIDDCRKHGAFDPRTMGNVSNIGLMAQKAEEYGSHDKTFEIEAHGTVSVVDDAGNTLLEHEVEAGDIWRMCQTKDLPIRDWVGLGVRRARETGAPAIFWLDENRAHDSVLRDKVARYLADHDTSDVDIRVLAPVEAMRATLERVRAGEDTVSVTGNVLRDYLTDLFPILELGTSAKMLSIVPLLAGGGLYETGAGGSAPKHVRQFLEEGHLRWDSLGEFLALAASLEDLGRKSGNAKAVVLGTALDRANAAILDNKRSPSRKAGELDNRGSHFYLGLYWAQALAAQSEDRDLSAKFGPVASELENAERTIIGELDAAQGKPVDIGGYYHPDAERMTRAMRPSATLNSIIDALR